MVVDCEKAKFAAWKQDLHGESFQLWPRRHVDTITTDELPRKTLRTLVPSVEDRVLMLWWLFVIFVCVSRTSDGTHSIYMFVLVPYSLYYNYLGTPRRAGRAGQAGH